MSLTIFHEKVENFQRFIRKESIDEDLVNLAIDHYRYIWKKTKGSKITNFLSEFHSQMHEELCFDLYSNTFQMTEFLSDADSSLHRLLAVQVHEMYFKKDVEIIRCNDIQKMVYVISKGKVEVSVAKMRLCHLGAGGMFGAFKGTGKTRQTITVTARYHCRVLAIDGDQFYKVLF